MMSIYFSKAYKGGKGVWKSPNLNIYTLWMVPNVKKSMTIVKEPMKVFSPHLEQKLWPKIWSPYLWKISFLLSAGLPLHPIIISGHMGGLNLYGASTHLIRYILIIRSCGMQLLFKLQNIADRGIQDLS